MNVPWLKLLGTEGQEASQGRLQDYRTLSFSTGSVSSQRVEMTSASASRLPQELQSFTGGTASWREADTAVIELVEN